MPTPSRTVDPVTTESGLTPTRAGTPASARKQAAGSRGVALLVAAAGGLITETAFPGKSWWVMAYLGVALLLLVLRTDSIRAGFVRAFVFGLGLFLPHLWWANEAVGQPIGWLALSAAQAGMVGAFGVSVVWVRRTPAVRSRAWLDCVAVAVLWVAVEHLRGRVPFGGFPWATLAFSQTDAPMLGLAPVGGSTLVSFIVVLVAAVLAKVLAYSRQTGPTRGVLAGMALAAGLVLAPGLLPLATEAQSGVLRVGAVQGNVPVRGAEATSQARAVLQNHAAGTRAMVQRTAPDRLDLVLWPERASDIDPRTDDRARAVVDGAARAAGAPILLGTQRFRGEIRYNDYLLWRPSIGAAASYTKQHPVPFGEYIPYRSFFRRLTPAVDLVTTDMVAGADPSPIAVPIDRLGRSVPITTGICFEVAYDDLIRQSVLAGGELIVIPTNNASFGMTQESTQQLAMSRFRAAEHGRAVIQISTVGVSAVIAPDGSVVERTSLFTADQLVAEVPLRTSTTLSDQLGRWLAVAVDCLAGLLLAGTLVTTLRSRRATKSLRDGR